MCHPVISAFWCSRGTYNQVRLVGDIISALWCRRAMEHLGQLQWGHLTWVYLHSGVVGLCTTRFDDQGVGGTSDLGTSAFCHMSN